MTAAAPAHYDPARYRRNIRVYYLFMAATGFMIFLPIWIIYLLNHRELSLTEVGVFESFFFLTVILGEVPTGAVADRFGRKVSLALGAVLFAVSILIFGQASHFAILLGSYLVMGLAMTLYSGASEALLYDTLRVLGRTAEYEHHAGRSHGLFWLMMVLATAVGGPLSYLIGYAATISISAIFFIVAAVAAMLLREPPRRESDFPVDPLHAPPAGLEHRDDHTQQSGGIPILNEMINGFKIVWRIKPVRYLIPFAAVLVALYDMPRFLTQPFVAQHGLDPLDSALDGFIWSALMIPAYFGTMLGMLGAAPLVNRFGPRKAFPMLLVFGAVFMIPLLIWNHLGLLSAIFMVSIAQAAVRPITTGYVNRRITSDQRATVLSIFSLVGGGAMSIILISIVPFADIISFSAAFALDLLVALTLGVGLCLLWLRAHRRDHFDRIRRWSLSVPKPQAPQSRKSTNGATSNGTGGEAGRAVFRNVQNLD